MADPRHAMDLDRLSRQIRDLMVRLQPPGPDGPDEAPGARPDLSPEETAAALDATVEELRVAEEELWRQSRLLAESRGELKRARQENLLAFDKAPDGLLVTDLNGIIHGANDAALALLDVPARFLVGKPLAVFVAVGRRMQFRAELNRLSQRAGVTRLNFDVEPRGRPPVPVAATVNARLDSGGTPTSLIWSLRDATRAALTEEQLRPRAAEVGELVRARTAQLEADLQARERLLIQAHAAAAATEASARRFAELVQDADAILWRADVATGRFTFVNRRAEELFGPEARRWLAEPDAFADRVHPDDREYVTALRRRALAEGRHAEGEYRLIAPDGRTLWFHESVHPVADEAGPPRELAGLMVHIGRRKKVERQLYAARSELAARLDDLSYLHELTGRLTGSLELQEALEEVISAVTAIQGTDMGLLRLYDPEADDLPVAASVGLPADFPPRLERIPRGEGICGRVLATGAPVVVTDIETDPAMPSYRADFLAAGIRACYSTPLRNRAGEFLGTIAAYFPEPHRPQSRPVHLQDMYARLAADMIDHARQHAAAREADRRKEVFLATLSHELRNPLAALRSAVALLRRPEPDPAALDVIERQVGQLSRLVDDLLDAARLARGKIELHPRAVPVAEAVAGAVAAVRSQVEARGLALEVALPAEPLAVEADPTRLEQVLVNLLTNAAKYTEPGGHIAVSAAREGAEVVFRVRDDGIGIAPEVLPHLFELFAQADPAAERSGGGLGIGLALVKSLVERHGGRVSAASPGPGRGSEFTVRLPAAEPVASPSPPPLNGSAPPLPRRVLIVDDDVDAAHLLARLLGSAGHHASVAHDGPTALALAAASPPEVVLLDLTLPGADGLDVARRLLQLPLPSPPRLVALTGHSDDDHRRRALAAGFAHYLVKPIDPEALRRALAELEGAGPGEPHRAGEGRPIPPPPELSKYLKF
jgi:PAS domain S-box-containing protein